METLIIILVAGLGIFALSFLVAACMGFGLGPSDGEQNEPHL